MKKIPMCQCGHSKGYHVQGMWECTYVRPDCDCMSYSKGNRKKVKINGDNCEHIFPVSGEYGTPALDANCEKCGMNAEYFSKGKQCLAKTKNVKVSDWSQKYKILIALIYGSLILYFLSQIIANTAK